MRFALCSETLSKTTYGKCARSGKSAPYLTATTSLQEEVHSLITPLTALQHFSTMAIAHSLHSTDAHELQNSRVKLISGRHVRHKIDLSVALQIVDVLILNTENGPH
jgi:hypothetical protein